MRRYFPTLILFVILIQNLHAQKGVIINNNSNAKWNHFFTSQKEHVLYPYNIYTNNTYQTPFYVQDSVVSFNAVFVSAEIIAINYKSLEGINPKEFEYYIAIWQGRQIFKLSRADQIQKITNTTQDGSFNFENLEITEDEYTIAIGVNLRDSTSVVSSIHLPKDRPQFSKYTSSNSSIKISLQNPNSLIAYFETLEYNSPKENQNWIGLFKGNFTSNFFYGINFIHSTFVTSIVNTGYVSMNNIPGGLEENETYTLVYGTNVHKNQSLNFNTIIAYTEFKVPKRK